MNEVFSNHSSCAVIATPNQSQVMGDKSNLHRMLSPVGFDMVEERKRGGVNERWLIDHGP